MVLCFTAIRALYTTIECRVKDADCQRCPCLTCSVKIVQVGITEVVFSQSYHMDTQVGELSSSARAGLIRTERGNLQGSWRTVETVLTSKLIPEEPDYS